MPAEIVLQDQTAMSNIDREEACGETVAAMARSWGGLPTSAQEAISRLRTLGNRRAGLDVSDGTTMWEMDRLFADWALPRQWLFGPCGDLMEQCNQRGHFCMAAVWWDGWGHLGGQFGHWVGRSPVSRRIANPYGGVWNNWSVRDLNTFGMGVTCEFTFGAGALAAPIVPIDPTEEEMLYANETDARRARVREMYHDWLYRVVDSEDAMRFHVDFIGHHGVDSWEAFCQNTADYVSKLRQRQARLAGVAPQLDEDAPMPIEEELHIHRTTCESCQPRG